LILSFIGCGYRQEGDKKDIFKESSFFCMWAYGIGADVPVEIKYFNNNYFDDDQIIPMAVKSNTVGKLYWLLYVRYRCPELYEKVKAMIPINEMIEYRSGCKYYKISCLQAMEIIDKARYDWAGVICGEAGLTNE
jgi:hypothetical protein